MPKPSMKSRMAESLKAEDEAVRSRFEKAESLLGTQTSQSSQPKTSIEELESSPQPKTTKPRSQKVIRDSFSLPPDDYELIAQIKQRCLGLAISANKSEVIRAGLHALTHLCDEDLCSVVQDLEKVKTGRPRESN